MPTVRRRGKRAAVGSGTARFGGSRAARRKPAAPRCWEPAGGAGGLGGESLAQPRDILRVAVRRALPGEDVEGSGELVGFAVVERDRRQAAREEARERQAAARQVAGVQAVLDQAKSRFPWRQGPQAERRAGSELWKDDQAAIDRPLRPCLALRQLEDQAEGGLLLRERGFPGPQQCLRRRAMSSEPPAASAPSRRKHSRCAPSRGKRRRLHRCPDRTMRPIPQRQAASCLSRSRPGMRTNRSSGRSAAACSAIAARRSSISRKLTRSQKVANVVAEVELGCRKPSSSCQHIEATGGSCGRMRTDLRRATCGLPARPRRRTSRRAWPDTRRPGC